MIQIKIKNGTIMIKTNIMIKIIIKIWTIIKVMETINGIKRNIWKNFIIDKKNILNNNII
jgi:hypothetical protein